MGGDAEMVRGSATPTFPPKIFFWMKLLAVSDTNIECMDTPTVHQYYTWAPIVEMDPSATMFISQNEFKVGAQR